MEEWEKEWKEAIKLTTRDKLNVAFSITLFVLNIVNAIVHKNLLYIIIAVLWLTIGIIEYGNAQIYRRQQYLIKEQDTLIKNILKSLKERNDG